MDNRIDGKYCLGGCGYGVQKLADDLIKRLAPLLEIVYPAKVFDGSSGDPGAVEVVETRKMLEMYNAGYGYSISKEEIDGETEGTV